MKIETQTLALPAPAWHTCIDPVNLKGWSEFFASLIRLSDSEMVEKRQLHLRFQDSPIGREESRAVEDCIRRAIVYRFEAVVKSKALKAQVAKMARKQKAQRKKLACLASTQQHLSRRAA